MTIDSSQLQNPLYIYVDGDGKVRTLIAKRYPFKKVENYFTDSHLYQDSLEADENPQLEELDSGNEVDVKPGAEEECLWDLNPLVMRELRKCSLAF